MVLVRRARFLTRNLWKLGFVLAGAVLLTSRGASDTPHYPQLGAKVAAAQSVPCGTVGSGIITWSAPSYILPISPGNDPVPDPANPPCASGVVVGPGTTLVLDASAGPMHIFSSGAGLNVQGGTLETINTDATHTVSFEAAADVASWDGINFTASGSSKGNGSLSYVSIQGALRSIQISSGATSSPADSHYGLTVANSGIGFSYFDGIDAIDTPISVTGLNDGKVGTINNIGSIGISATFGSAAPAIPADALHIDGMTFGSSAPFGVAACPSNQPCYIGNQAVFGSFVPHAQQPVSIKNTNFYRAGTYGVQLESANQPVLANNLFVCNGLGAPTAGSPCTGSGPIYSAVYLNQATANLAQSGATGQVTGNHGYENGLDAIAFNGVVDGGSSTSPTVPTLTWQNATNATSDHSFGYLLTGDLNMANGSFKVPAGSVVKTLGGTINLTNSTLDANDAGLKTFTSLRDPIGIASCPSVFSPSCGPAVLPGGEWGGINLSGGSSANIEKANIFYATTGVRISSGATTTQAAPGFALSVADSTIGPTFSDGIFASATPITVSNTNFQCVAAGCQALAAGDHGISADFTGSPALGGGLRVVGSAFFGSVNEGIKGTGLAGQTVDLENNAVDHAGVSGIQLLNADHPVLKQNSITNSGTRTPTYPAIYLNGVAGADFNSAIAGNTGARNGLDAIAFHGATATPLTWKTIANSTASTPLGYMLDGPLAVNGGMALNPNDYVPTSGSITVTGGPLTANGAVVSSLKDSTVNIPTCGSIFDQRVSSACPRPAPGDWGGFALDSHFPNALSGGEIRYAATGIAMGKPGIAAPLTLNGTNLRSLSSDGIATHCSLDVTGGAFSNIAGRALNIDLTGSGPASVSIANSSISGTGTEGIMAAGLAGETVTINGVSVDHAGATGINLVGPDTLTLTNNTVTNTAARYPAIYLNGFSGPFATVSGNKGNSNGLDALVFHGVVKDDLSWITARRTSTAKALGYLLDGDLSLPGTLTVNAGDIVKSAGAFNIGRLKADDTGNASQKIFSSLADDSVGVHACGSVLLPGCSGPALTDWGGISLRHDGALVNAAIRYATTGVSISSKATSTFGSSSYALLVSRSRIDLIKADAIDTSQTAVSVTDTSIDGGIHGINADFTGAANSAALRLSGNRFSGTGAEAVLGQALGGHPLWITDNHVQNAGTFAVRLVDADQLVLRNNNVSASGGVSGPASARYPAIYLSHVTADFARDVRGNVGNGNGLDAVLMNGTAVGGLSWITPTAVVPTHSLGYLLDGALTVQGGTMTVRNGDVVKARGGPITIKGATLTSNGGTFTSLTDPAGPVSCPSAFVTFCGAAPGDWGGLVVTQDAAGTQSSAVITGGAIHYAETALATDNGPTTAANPAVTLSGVAISNVSKDGVNSVDTPITVDTTTMSAIGSHGIIASFFSPANCPSSNCRRFTVNRSTITGAVKDGIVANGLGGQPVVLTGNTVTGSGTYGIRLVGADVLTDVSKNAVNASGTTVPKFPAIYLSGVSGDFQGAITANTGTGNGLDAVVFHGVATGGLSWLTPGTLGSTLGYMLDGPLTVDGPFTTTGVVKVLSGAIKVNGLLHSSETAFTSMKNDTVGMSACSTILVNCSGGPTNTDWNGINVDPIATSTFIGGSITDATSGITMGSGELDMTGATITNISGYAVQTKGTGNALITCTGIHGNGGGLLSNGAPSSIDNSDLYGNASTLGKDLDGTTATTTRRIWWGTGTPGPVTQYNPATVTVNQPLPQQEPTVKAAGLSSVVFSSDNTNSDSGHFGKGTLTVTLTFDRTMNLDVPLGVIFSSLDARVHAVTGDWTRTDNVTWVGHAVIDESALTGQEGLNSLTVTSGTSCMRDGNNVMKTETAPFNLDFGTATVDNTAGATHVGARSATINGVVNARGWSVPTSNPASQTYAFVESAPLGSALPAPATVISGVTNVSTLPGYVQIGHGIGSVPVSQALAGLSPNTSYQYAFVAVDLNGITNIGTPQTFTTTGPVTHFELSSTSGTTTAGDPYPFTVTAKDSANRIVADYTGTVHFSLARPDSQATLPSDYAFQAVSTTGPGDDGMHSFTATLKTAANPQTIIATDTVITAGGSLPVTVKPAPASQLVMSQQPTTTVAGAAIAPAVTVLVEDPFGNVETGDTGTEHPVSVALASGSPSAALLGTRQQNDVKGVATFNDLSIQSANTGYALHATSPGLTAVDSTPFNITPDVLHHLVLTPSSGSISAGASQSYTAEGFDQFSNSRGDVTPATVLTLSPDGSCTGASCTATLAGAHTVTGTDAGKTGTASLTVNPGALHHLVLAPATASIVAGGSQTYTAQGSDQYGNTLGDVTTATTFSILPNGSCSLATCTASVAGSHTVTGTDSGKTGTASLTVNAGPLSHLVLSPSPAAITAGGSQAYTAEGFDSSNNDLGDQTSGTTFTIAPDGSCAGATCTPTASGSHTVTGTDVTATGTATLTVNAGPLDHLVLAPATASITAGGSQAYTAEGFDSHGNDLGDKTPATTFVVSPDGSCTGASCTATVSGAHTVSGTDGAATGPASLTVTPGPLDHLRLSPASQTIAAGGSQGYTAEGFDQFENDLGDRTASTTFGIAPDGSCTLASCTASLVGGHTVTGTSSGKTGTASLAVSAGSLHHLDLSPSTATIAAGASQPYTAQGFDQYGNSLGDVTATTSFAIGPDGSCAGASCTATVGGAHTVTGTDAGKTGTASLTVSAGPLDHLALAPATTSIVAGGSQAYTAEGFDFYGNDLGNKTLDTTFTIAPNGSCTGASCSASVAGSHTVTGTDTGKLGSASLTVNAGPLDHLVLSPATATITAGGSQAYTAEGFDSFSNDLGDKTSGTTFTIVPDGSCTLASCTASTAGSHTVTGTNGTATGSATLSVNPAPPPAPVVTGISPTSGPAAGGTSVTINGSNLASATAVNFGAVAGTIVTDTPTQIVAKSPTSSPGPVDVTVTTAGGTSATSVADQFSFVSYSATVLADAPSIYWRLGEASGTTATDSTVLSHDGTYSAGVTLGQAGALVGDSDKAVSLDGVTGSIQETSGAGAPVGAAKRSFETWFKTTVATPQPLINYGTTGLLSQFSVYVGANQIQVKDGTDTLTFTALASLSDGLWHHLVVAYDGAFAVTVFADGAVVGVPLNTSGALATALDASGVEVGRDSTTFFTGSLDEVAVYVVDLSSTRVAAHYHAGHGD